MKVGQPVTVTVTVTVTVRMASMKLNRLSALVFCIYSTTAFTQTIPGSITNLSGGTTGSGASVANQASGPPSAETGTPARAWAIKPRIRLTETLSDNVAINRSQGNKEGDLITQLSPGIRIDGKSARLKALFDYALNAQMYAKTDYSRTQNSLNSFATLEAVDNWLFVDANARIAQQSISAFGAQSPGTSSINANSTETRTFGLTPYIRGELGGLVDYSLRHNRSTTRSDANRIANIDLSEWAGQVKGSTPFRNLQWAADAITQSADYSTGRKTDASRFTGRLTYAITPQFRIIGSGGWEENNYASVDQQGRTTHGYGFDWNPTERTKFSAFKERRFFGDGHNISFSHRFPKSSIRFTDTRNVSVLPNQFASQGYGDVYDLIAAQFASLPEPDRTTAIQNFFLANPTLDPNAQVTSSFLTSRATIQRRQQLSLVFLGARNSITLLANRNLSQSTLASAGAVDDFTQASEIRQQGFSVNYSHRLSSLSTLNALLSRQESTGSGTNTLKTTTNLYQLNLSTKLGAKTLGSLSVRHSDSDGTVSFKENALIGTLTYTY